MKIAKAAFMLSACVGMLFAQASTTTTTTTTTTPPAKPVAVKALKVVGSIVSVDAIANSLIVKTAKAEDTLSVETGAKILSANKAITLADLKTGEKVVVFYKTEEGKKVAVEVKVAPPAAEKKAAK
jgi:hypothetical protein